MKRSILAEERRKLLKQAQHMAAKYRAPGSSRWLKAERERDDRVRK